MAEERQQEYAEERRVRCIVPKSEVHKGCGQYSGPALAVGIALADVAKNHSEEGSKSYGAKSYTTGMPPVVCFELYVDSIVAELMVVPTMQPVL